MKYMFKLFLCLLSLVALNCKEDKEIFSESVTKDIVGTMWRLKAFVPEKIFKIIPPEGQVYTIKFLNDSTYTGKSDCNQIRGKYLLDPPKIIKILNTGTTYALCPDNSLYKQYLLALRHVNSYKIEKDELYLFCDDNSKLHFICEE